MYGIGRELNLTRIAVLLAEHMVGRWVREWQCRWGSDFRDVPWNLAGEVGEWEADRQCTSGKTNDLGLLGEQKHCWSWSKRRITLKRSCVVIREQDTWNWKFEGVKLLIMRREKWWPWKWVAEVAYETLPKASEKIKDLIGSCGYWTHQKLLQK